MTAIDEGEFQFTTPSGVRIGGQVIGQCVSGKEPILYFHGFPGSRVEARLARSTAASLGVAVIAVDRPGIGLSDYVHYEDAFDAVAHFEAALDHFGFERVAVMGVSGGTPYALAFSLARPERVTRCAIVSGLYRPDKNEHRAAMNWANRGLLTLGCKYPALAVKTVRLMAMSWRRVPKLAELWFGLLLPASDRRIVTRKTVLPVLSRNVSEALRQGVQGVTADFRRFLQPWKVSVERLTVPLRVWHGTSDDYVPSVMGRSLVAEAGRGTFVPIHGAGHYMIVDQLADVIGWCSGPNFE